jgi:hypothetical protein
MLRRQKFTKFNPRNRQGKLKMIERLDKLTRISKNINYKNNIPFNSYLLEDLVEKLIGTKDDVVINEKIPISYTGLLKDIGKRTIYTIKDNFINQAISTGLSTFLPFPLPQIAGYFIENGFN